MRKSPRIRDEFLATAVRTFTMRVILQSCRLPPMCVPCRRGKPMSTVTEARQPRPAAEWGLSALLLSTVVLIMFPLMAFLVLGCLIAAWESRGVQSQHIDFGVIGAYVVVYGLLLLSVFALCCGV